MEQLPAPHNSHDSGDNEPIRGQVLHGELLDLDEEWDARKAMKDLRAERDVLDDTTTNQTQRIIEDGAPMAARSLVHIAAYAERDSDRIKAATEVLKLSREMGGNATDPLRLLAGMVVQEMEEAAASAANQGDALGDFFDSTTTKDSAPHTNQGHAL